MTYVLKTWTLPLGDRELGSQDGSQEASQHTTAIVQAKGTGNGRQIPLLLLQPQLVPQAPFSLTTGLVFTVEPALGDVEKGRFLNTWS